MTVISDTVQGPDHDCGGDHRSKLGCYGVYVEPSFPNRSIQCAFFVLQGAVEAGAVSFGIS